MEPSPFKILMDTSRWVAVDKAIGVPVIPERGKNPARPLVDLVSEQLGVKVYVVHRLDRDTSGLVLFAKDAETHRYLGYAFEHREVKKKYLAGVLGRLEGEGIVDQPLKEFGSGRIGVHPDGKAALTRYRVLRSGEDSSWLEVAPETGRRHQIRVHLYSIGHPVLGDTVYGQNRPVGGGARLMLHALELSFTDSIGVDYTVRAEAPEEFTNPE